VVPLEDSVDAVIDEIGGAWPSEQMADRETMDHPARRMKRARRIVFDRLARIVDREETTLRIERLILEKPEQIVGVAPQPTAMIGILPPGGGGFRRAIHCLAPLVELTTAVYVRDLFGGAKRKSFVFQSSVVELSPLAAERSLALQTCKRNPGFVETQPGRKLAFLARAYFGSAMPLSPQSNDRNPAVADTRRRNWPQPGASRGAFE
jgi:hypothetical protein